MFLISIAEYFLLSMIYVRILEEMRTKINFSSEISRIFVAIWCVFPLIIAVFSHFSQFQMVIFQFALLILAKIAPKVAKQWQKSLFQRQILPYVNTICLRLRVGDGLEEALRVGNAQQTGLLRPIFQTISERSRLPKAQTNEKFFEMDILECGIRSAFQNPHTGRRTIEALRYRLTVEAQFRRKLRAISAQVRAQMMISVGIYCAAVWFIHQRYGAQKFILVIGVSGILTVFGMLALRHLLMRFAWKV